jgi:hypothetical protein
MAGVSGAPPDVLSWPPALGLLFGLGLGVRLVLRLAVALAVLGAACSAADQSDDLIATARAVDSMYVEWRRSHRTGMHKTQEGIYDRYAQSDSPARATPTSCLAS